MRKIKALGLAVIFFLVIIELWKYTDWQLYVASGLNGFVAAFAWHEKD